jgi:hypothetical protein
MARKSFTLQKLSAEYGSYVQYPSGTGAASVGLTVRTDDDSRLKSDDLLVAPILNIQKMGSHQQLVMELSLLLMQLQTFTTIKFLLASGLITQCL